MSTSVERMSAVLPSRISMPSSLRNHQTPWVRSSDFRSSVVCHTSVLTEPQKPPDSLALGTFVASPGSAVPPKTGSCDLAFTFNVKIHKDVCANEEAVTQMTAKRPRDHRETEAPMQKRPSKKTSATVDQRNPEMLQDGLQVPKTRRVMITKDMLLRIGYTQGCAGCIAVYNGTRRSAHSEICRHRIEGRLREEGHEGLARAEAKKRL